MNPKPTAPPAPIITLHQIYYILFRHKWMIAILALLALTAAVVVRFVWPWPYESEARLLIKYIKETRPPQEKGDDQQVTVSDSRADIISGEIAILTSMDLAKHVAEIVGPAKILATAGGGSNVFAAAAVISKQLIIPESADAARRSDVIQLIFTHKDPEVTSNVLAALIDAYQDKQKEVHSPGFNDYLQQEIDRVKHEEEQTVGQLRDAKSNSGIVSIDDSKKNYSDLLAGLEGKLNDAVAEQAATIETIHQMRIADGDKISTNGTETANSSAQQVEQVPPDKLAEYKRLSTKLVAQQAQLEDLLTRFRSGYPDVQIKEKQIAETTAAKEALEKTYHSLTEVKPTIAANSSGRLEPDPRDALNEQIFKADALASKIQALTNEMAKVQTMGATIIAQEGPIERLLADKAIEDAKLTFYTQKLEDARSQELLTGNFNIAEVESPTPPMRDLHKITKATLSALMAGLAFALGLPFFIELVLDRSLKHPEDCQNKLGLPFFITIPQLNGHGKPRGLKGGKKRPLLPAAPANGAVTANGSDPHPAPAAPANGSMGTLALWDERQSLQPFYETLRDRLMTFFEMINLTHKPKLVAVTGCREGAGVTSTAAGLASSLSETGDGNVLLVNMNATDGEAHHFYKGKLACGLDQVLEKGTREGACVQGNLYVAKEEAEDERLPRVLPKRFNHLLPKMKASDFDYIIFDMPPVSQISITPRLARYMDMVLLVVESGKTDRDAAKRAADLLSESKTNVGVVLNKNRSYVPRRLHQDI